MPWVDKHSNPKLLKEEDCKKRFPGGLKNGIMGIQTFGHNSWGKVTQFNAKRGKIEKKKLFWRGGPSGSSAKFGGDMFMGRQEQTKSPKS